MVRQASEPEADRPRDRTGADTVDVRGAFGGRSDPLGRETLKKLAQQERRSAGRADARIDEACIGSPA